MKIKPVCIYKPFRIIGKPEEEKERLTDIEKMAKRVDVEGSIMRLALKQADEVQ